MGMGMNRPVLLNASPEQESVGAAANTTRINQSLGSPPAVGSQTPQRPRHPTAAEDHAAPTATLVALMSAVWGARSRAWAVNQR
jgi:hypothetical protein